MQRNASTTPRVRAAPRWPLVMVGAMATAASVSILQGFLDIAIPAIIGAPPFVFMFALVDRFGPLFFVAYVFIHNVGLACLVPGLGLVAARYERNPRMRGYIPIILASAVAISLLAGLAYLFQAAERFDLAFALPLFFVEASAVMIVAVDATRELTRFVPTRAVAWSFVTPLRRLAPTLLASMILLALAAGVEAYFVLFP